jgi:hypothetical protein
MARADVIAANVTAGLQYNGGGVSYVVQKNGAADTYYVFIVDGASDLSYIKSTDGGFTWSIPVLIRTGTIVAFSNWYRRWSGIASDVIDIAYIDANDIFYRSLDISTDTLGTETTVFDGASSAANGALSIATGRNGHIRVAGAIDGGTEDGAWSSTDDGATWGDTIADPSEGATADQYYMLPGWNADTADVMLIFVDSSANGISVKRYDDSGDTWGETAIIADGSFTDSAPSGTFPHIACVVDIANSRNIVACWSAVDAANADLRVFIIDDTTITETATNAVLNSTDDQGLAAFGIDTDTGTWYVFYAGAADGSETFNSSLKIYYKTSTDSGATWSAQTALSAQARNIPWLACTPRFATKFLTAFYYEFGNLDQIIVSALIPTAGGGGLASNVFGGSVIH